YGQRTLPCRASKRMPAQDAAGFSNAKASGRSVLAASDQLLDRRNRNGLDEMGVEARFPRAFPVRRLSPARHGIDRDVSAPGALTNPPARLETVEPRHADVEQDQVRAKVLRDLDGLQSVSGGADVVPDGAEHLGHRRRRVRVVVGHEDAASLIVPVGFGWGPDAARAEQWERNDEFAAFTPAFAVSVDRATVQLDEPLRDGQSEPEAVPRLAGPLLALHEHLENAREERRLDADTVVGDAHPSLVADGLELDVDASARFGVLRRVGEDVRERLREPYVIAVDADRGRRRAHV